MNILFIAPWAPVPLRPRSYGLLRELAGNHRVTVVCQTWGENESTELEKLKLEMASLGVRFIEVRESRALAIARALLALPTREPLQRAYVRSGRLLEVVDRIVVQERPDIAYFNVLRGTAAEKVNWDITRVVDLDEFRSQYFAQTATLARSPFWRLVGRIEAARQSVAEVDIVTRYDRVLVSSPRDLRQGSGNVRLVRSMHTMPVDLARGQENIENDRPLLSMVGRFSYRANHDGAMWLAERVMPLVWRDHPDAILQLVGAEPKRQLRRLAGERIRVLGRVADVAPYYRAAWINLVPVTTATGVQMKFIEAAHLAVPSVVTPVVANGAGVNVGVGCMVANSAAEWAQAVSKLIQDPTLRHTIGQAGQEWAELSHSRSAVGAELADSLCELLPRIEK